MEVVITEKSTRKIVARYMISLRGNNYTPSYEEHFLEAWRCAVEDGVVDVDSRDKYNLSLIN